QHRRLRDHAGVPEYRTHRRHPAASVGERRSVRSEEHTSELQSLTNLVCRLLLEKKKKNKKDTTQTHKQQIQTLEPRCPHKQRTTLRAEPSATAHLLPTLTTV